MSAAPRAALWRDANLRWLMGGSTLSLLGDQFTLSPCPGWCWT